MYMTFKLKIRHPCFDASEAADIFAVLASRWEQSFEKVSANQPAYQYTPFHCERFLFY